MTKKTVLAINGSPRRNANTATLLNYTLKGAEEAGAKTEIVHLYSLNFKGCISCFSCKRKDREHGHCAMNDDLSPVLEHIKEVDAVVFGTPIYFMNITSGLFACIERLFFSNYLYSNEIPTVFPKKMPSCYIYTMNMTQKQAEQYNMREKLAIFEQFTAQHFGVEPKTLWAYNTYQFKDYSKYESSIFSEPDKADWRNKFWSKQCDEAYQIGKSLVTTQIQE